MQLYHFMHTYANFQFYLFFRFVNENHKVTKKNKEANALNYLAGEISLLTTIISNSNSPPEPTPLLDSSEQMPNFNNLFHEGVSKMMRVRDDLHRMVDYMYIRDLTIIGILIFFILKYRNGKQKRRRRSNRGKYRVNGIRSEKSSIGNRYMNENSDAFMSKVPAILIGGNSDAHSDGSFDDVLICGECRFRTNDINKFADHKSRKCSNITKALSEPESIQCCENTFKNSWKLLEHLTEKHNLNLYRDASTTDDSQEISREMLCNKNSPILYDSTDAHEMSKDYCIGKIVDEGKQTYTYDKKPISPKRTTSTTSRGFNGINKNNFSNNNITNTGEIGDIFTNKQTNFNQYTTNFIVCCSDSLKPFV